MNTDIRRAIFFTIMTSDDYMDAFEKLLKLNLKGKQEREIIKVILQCCCNEKIYNEFYSLLTEKFCSFNFNFKFTLQYQLWDRFKIIKDMKLYQLVNLSKFLSHLIGSSVISLSVLKIIDFTNISDITSILFFRLVFVELFTSFDQETVVELFSRLINTVDLAELSNSLLIFISKGMKQLSTICNHDKKKIKKVKHTSHQVKLILRQAPLLYSQMHPS
eukprot:TRINITY_DN3894_c0_g1_i1.p1 TRINITY_DN3894_c0_g1~~TRINITY_DN3894_c0_g1_i1.p1  ORF type:complete len:218 (+),score=36.91 TRINITY_DN3894_c0_g1_i1:230-883(+)